MKSRGSSASKTIHEAEAWVEKLIPPNCEWRDEFFAWLRRSRKNASELARALVLDASIFEAARTYPKSLEVLIREARAELRSRTGRKKLIAIDNRVTAGSRRRLRT